MIVGIAGAHGKIGLRLVALLAAAGHEPRGLVRDPAHGPDVEERGGAVVIADLESDDPLDDLVAGADAVVFTAGAGAGSGPERKRTVDYGGAVRLIDAAKRLGVRRYVMVSSIGAHDPASAPDAMRAYLQAKHDADEALIASGLDYTIVRPGTLTDDPGTGRIEIFTDLGHRGRVTRDDVAATLVATLEAPNTIRKLFELFNGDTPIAEALARL
jgi:uncharacterized protein YbjT (DUF2867 family)